MIVTDTKALIALLIEKGIITEAEFDKKRKELIQREQEERDAYDPYI